MFAIIQYNACILSFIGQDTFPFLHYPNMAFPGNLIIYFAGVPVVVTGAVTGVPSFLGVTNAPGGLVQISKDTFRINGVPSSTPGNITMLDVLSLRAHDVILT